MFFEVIRVFNVFYVKYLRTYTKVSDIQLIIVCDSYRIRILFFLKHNICYEE